MPRNIQDIISATKKGNVSVFFKLTLTTYIKVIYITYEKNEAIIQFHHINFNINGLLNEKIK